MGRRSQGRSLAVWTNGVRVGRWLVPARGAMEFAYDPEWVVSNEARPLSLSLPINLDGLPVKGERVGFFFDNLLPDSDVIRRRLESRFRTPRGNSFELLEAIGRDCVGAVQLLPEGTTPQGVFDIDVSPLEDSEVEELLLRAVAEPGLPVGDEDEDFRVSLAGAQEKTALTWHQRRWCRPHGATPTTHIFKLPLGLVGARGLDMSTSLENEWLCARLLEQHGLSVASSELARFGATKALVVSRFDRRLHASRKYWLRLPQEDFCQATGTPSHLRYESDGGPGLVNIARILQGSASREHDLATLLKAELLFWGLAATDGHAKNFSIRLLAQGRYRLTPLYDVLSAWPIAGNRPDQVHASKLKLAMAVFGTHKHYRISEIGRRHFNMTAQRCGLGADMEAIISEVISKTPTAIASVEAALPRDFPEKVFRAVTTGLKRSMRQLAAMSPR